jgi:predicted transcriptional regulator
VGLAKSLGWGIVRGPYWNSSHIHPINTTTRHNSLYIESASDEIRDGDYVRTSIGNGTVYVYLSPLRRTASSSTRAKASRKETSTSSGGTSC